MKHTQPSPPKKFMILRFTTEGMMIFGQKIVRTGASCYAVCSFVAELDMKKLSAQTNPNTRLHSSVNTRYGAKRIALVNRQIKQI